MARRVQGIRSAKYRAIETLTHQTRGNVVPAGGKPNIQRCCGADERSDIRGGFASGTALRISFTRVRPGKYDGRSQRSCYA